MRSPSLSVRQHNVLALLYYAALAVLGTLWLQATPDSARIWPADADPLSSVPVVSQRWTQIRHDCTANSWDCLKRAYMHRIAYPNLYALPFDPRDFLAMFQASGYLYWSTHLTDSTCVELMQDLHARPPAPDTSLPEAQSLLFFQCVWPQQSPASWLTFLGTLSWSAA